MGSDLDVLIGKWIVKVRPPGRTEPWTWEYEFHSDGRVTWQDLKSPEKGSGNWAANSKLVNIWWKDSATRESWLRPDFGALLTEPKPIKGAEDKPTDADRKRYRDAIVKLTFATEKAPKNVKAKEMMADVESHVGGG